MNILAMGVVTSELAGESPYHGQVGERDGGEASTCHNRVGVEEVSSGGEKKIVCSQV